MPRRNIVKDLQGNLNYINDEIAIAEHAVMRLEAKKELVSGLLYKYTHKDHKEEKEE